MAKVKSERDLVDHGIQALADALGYSGAARFLRHFSKGNGDYLQTQEKLFRECVWTRYLKRPVSIIPANSVDGFPSLSLQHRSCLRSF
jgi:hypothetical protein